MIIEIQSLIDGKKTSFNFIFLPHSPRHTIASRLYPTNSN